ncbi:hypothetical protein Droror1_Dr00012324 [Drosera rotundifolia]
MITRTRGGFLVHYYPDALEFLESRTRIGDIVAKGYQGLLRYEGLAEGEVRELLWEKRAAAEGDGEALGVREKLCERERSSREAGKSAIVSGVSCAKEIEPQD